MRRPVVPQEFAEPEIDAIQAIAVHRSRLDDVEELDGMAARERPSKVGLELRRDERLRHRGSGRQCSESPLRRKGRLRNVPLTSTSIFGMV